MIERATTAYREYDPTLTYRDLLRPIGAYLDYMQASHVTVAETADGFLWHCYPQGDLTKPLSGFIARNAVPELATTMKQISQRNRRGGLFGRQGGALKVITRGARRKSVCPEGYQEAFRVLSRKLDEQSATNVVLMERNEGLATHFSGAQPAFRRLNPEHASVPFSFREETYSAQHMSALTIAERSHRGSKYYR